MIQKIKCLFGHHDWSALTVRSERVSRGDDWVTVHPVTDQCMCCGIERENVWEGSVISKEQYRRNFLAKRPKPQVIHWAPCQPDQHVFPFPKASPHGFTPAWAFADIYLTCERCGMQVPASRRFDIDYLANGAKSVVIPQGVAWGTAIPQQVFPATYPATYPVPRY